VSAKVNIPAKNFSKLISYVCWNSSLILVNYIKLCRHSLSVANDIHAFDKCTKNSNTTELMAPNYLTFVDGCQIICKELTVRTRLLKAEIIQACDNKMCIQALHKWLWLQSHCCPVTEGNYSTYINKTHNTWHSPEIYTRIMTSFNSSLSGTTWVSQYQKNKTNLDLLEQEIMSGSGIS